MLPDEARFLDDLSIMSDMVLATEYRSRDLALSGLPGSGPVITAGGFTIQKRSGRTDQEWRSRQAKIVKHDREIFNEAICEAAGEFGHEAFMVSILDQDSLPCGVYIPSSIKCRDDIASFFSQRKDMKDFVSQPFLDGLRFRRKSISLKAASNFLLSRKRNPGLRKTVRILRPDDWSKSYMPNARRILRRISGARN